MQIGTLDLGPRPVMLAPMEDVTDVGFRLLCRRMGARMVYSEFVAADALVRMVNKSLAKLTVVEEERPVAIQIYGRDPGAVAEAAEIVWERARPDVLDLNFGCPVKRVAGKGAGAGMLREPERMLEIVRAVVDRVGNRVPVTVKTRLGWDSQSLIITTLAEQLQDAGVSALTIHGRTRAQMYTGEADWTLIGECVRNPRRRIPIIGNGDLRSSDDVRRAFEDYGVDGVMIGRATFGRPWIFREIAEPDAVLTTSWKMQVLREQIRESIERIDERRGILHVRRHLAASPLFKNIPDFRQTRIAMLRADTADELFEILNRVEQMLT